MSKAKDLLKERFVRAVQKALPQTPLIGPKWFRYHQKGKPAHFQFCGVPKLAKATGKNPKYLAQMVLKNLNTRGLDVDVKLMPDYRINVTFNKPPTPQPEADPGE